MSQVEEVAKLSLIHIHDVHHFMRLAEVTHLNRRLYDAPL